MYDNNLLEYITTLFYCLILNDVLFDILFESRRYFHSSILAYYSCSIGSLPRLPGRSRAKYLVDEVPEKIENIILNYARVYTINYCEASARTYTFHIYL